MKKCAIFGASGHGDVVSEIAKLNSFKCYLFDDNYSDSSLMKKIEGNFDNLLNAHNEFDNVIVAIGNNKIRSKFYKKLESVNAEMFPLIHPNSKISESVKLGAGTVIMPGVVINTSSKIGKSAIVNTGVIVDHDCSIGDFCHLSPGSVLAGGVNIGSKTWIGLGSKIIQNIQIGKNVVVGAGSTVINNIKDEDKVVGTPAKSLK